MERALINNRHIFTPKQRKCFKEKRKIIVSIDVVQRKKNANKIGSMIHAMVYVTMTIYFWSALFG